LKLHYRKQLSWPASAVIVATSCYDKDISRDNSSNSKKDISKRILEGEARITNPYLAKLSDPWYSVKPQLSFSRLALSEHLIK
jgi:hypothetical protein